MPPTITIRPGSSEKTSGSGKAGSTELNRQFSGGNPVAANAAVLCESPADKDIIFLRPGQSAVIRLPVRYWDMKKDLDYFWTINSICPKEQHFYLAESKLVREGKKLWQEVLVTLCPSRHPKAAGNHCLGAIKAHNQMRSVMIIVELVIDKAITRPLHNSEYTKALRDLYAVYRELRAERNKSRQPEPVQEPAKVCYIIMDPWPDHRVAGVRAGDTVKVRLTKRLVTYPVPDGTIKTELARWHLSGLPQWLVLRESTDVAGESVYLFDVSPGSLIAPKSELKFRCQEMTRVFLVRLEEYQGSLSTVG